MDINSRNLGQQEEDLDKKKFRKRASMSRPTIHPIRGNRNFGKQAVIFVKQLCKSILISSRVLGGGQVVVTNEREVLSE